MNRLITLLFHDVFAQDPRESGFRGPVADRYKLTVDQFKRQLNSIAEQRSDAPVLVTDSVPADGAPPFAISFDDGGWSFYSVIAPILAAYGWRAHCFVTTGQLGKAGFLKARHVREIHAAGHLVGSHSATHPPRIDRCNREQLLAEWSRSKATLEDIIGDEVCVGSVPGGFFTPRVARAAQAAGLNILLSSEPETQVRAIGDCRVFGRFTLRRESPGDLSGRLVRAAANARSRQWLAWNTKKILKKTLGTGYVHLSSRLSRHLNLQKKE